MNYCKSDDKTASVQWINAIKTPKSTPLLKTSTFAHPKRVLQVSDRWLPCQFGGDICTPQRGLWLTEHGTLKWRSMKTIWQIVWTLAPEFSCYLNIKFYTLHLLLYSSDFLETQFLIIRWHHSVVLAKLKSAKHTEILYSYIHKIIKNPKPISTQHIWLTELSLHVQDLRTIKVALTWVTSRTLLREQLNWLKI